VVAHIAGAGGIVWTSDVRLFNRASSVQTATLIFTPSGHDGTIDFAAFKVSVDPQQVVTILDIVTQFAQLGSGQPEIDGDVVASSRLHGGGYELVPALTPADERTTTHLYGIRDTSATRTNIGFAETNGRPATVKWVTITGFDSVVIGTAQ